MGSLKESHNLATGHHIQASASSHTFKNYTPC